MFNRIFLLSVALSLMLLGCAEAPVKDKAEEPTELTAEELMYQQRQKTQRQMMQENRPMRIGPGSR